MKNIILKNKSALKILGILLLLFLFTRLYKISQIPGSVYWDEASIGYNAYSLSVDGRDEWGSFLPIHFRAFGEFKLPAYIYSVVPFVKIFGLNAISVRIPSVIYFGASVILIYFLVKKAYKDELKALLSTFLFVVLPWIFIFSRTGYEVSAGLFFFILGMYLFLFYENNIWFVFGSIFSFIIAAYSYNCFRILSPLMFVFMVGANFKQIIKKKDLPWVFVASFVVTLLFTVPIVKLYTLDTGAARLTTLSLTGTYIEKLAQFIRNYISHFSPEFLFFKGDSNLRSQMPGFGELYALSIPFVLLGLVALIKEKNKFSWIVLFGFCTSFIPASLTRESPHSLRSISASLFYSIIIAFGISLFVKVFKRYRKYALNIIVASYLIFFGLYFKTYISSYNKISSDKWQYGYKDLFVNHKWLIDQHSDIVVTDEYAEPYIFALYYLKHPPKEFRSSVVFNPVDKWGFSTVSSFGKFTFKKIDVKDINSGKLVVDYKMDRNFGECTEKLLFLDGTLSLCTYE